MRALRERRGQGRGEGARVGGAVEIRSGVNGKFHGKFMTFRRWRVIIVRYTIVNGL